MVVVSNSPHLTASHFGRGLFWFSIVFIVYIIPNVWCSCQGGELILPSADDTEPPLSDEMKDLIVTIHNYYRSCVALQNKQQYCTSLQYGTTNKQPGATYMLEMVWDDLLANFAQNWVNSCQEGHDSNDNLTNVHPEISGLIGSNIYTLESSGDKVDHYADPPVQLFLSNWFNENKMYTYQKQSEGECSQDVSACHYTQMVHANTYKVGCGYSYFRRKGGVRFPYVEYFACYYGPGGNLRNQVPYTAGTPVCKKKFVTGSYPGLCRRKSLRN